MDPATLLALLMQCAPRVDPVTARALIQVESAGNPWAIGVVGGALIRQPRHEAEALATARALRDAGWNFSLGLAQINQLNFTRLGLDIASAFEPCMNLAAMQTVLQECYERAGRNPGKAPAHHPATPDPQTALYRALSCYYSGNFSTGFRHGYVAKVVAAASIQRPPSQPTSRPPLTPMPAAGLAAATLPHHASTAKEPL